MHCHKEIVKPDPPAGSYVYGGEDRESAGDLIQLPDGNLLLVGGKVPDGRADYDTYLAIVSTDGALIQEATFGKVDAQEIGYRVTLLQDGNYGILVVSRGANYSPTNVQLLTVDANLNLVSQTADTPVNSPGNPSFTGAGFVQLTNGDFIITFTNNYVAYKLIMSSDWVLTSNEALYGLEGNDHRQRLCRMPNGEYRYYAGANGASNNTFHAAVINPQGVTLSTLNYTNAISEYCIVGAATTLRNGDVAVSISDLTDRSHEFGFVRSNGNWETVSSGSSSSNYGYAAMAELPNGDIALMGYASLLFQTYEPGVDDYAVQIRDSAGTIVRTTTFGGEDTDRPRAMIALADGRLAILGETQTFGAGATDLYLVIFDY